MAGKNMFSYNEYRCYNVDVVPSFFINNDNDDSSITSNFACWVSKKKSGRLKSFFSKNTFCSHNHAKSNILLIEVYSKYCSMSGKASVFHLMKNHTQQRYKIVHQMQRGETYYTYLYSWNILVSKIVELCQIFNGFQLFLNFTIIPKKTA